MVEVIVDETQVRLELIGLDRLWSFETRISFPLNSLTQVETDPQPTFKHPWWQIVRAPGTSIPGIIRAGTYRWRGDREFWCIHFSGQAVVFELEGQRYSRIVVDVRDPEAVVARLLEARLTAV